VVVLVDLMLVLVLVVMEVLVRVLVLLLTRDLVEVVHVNLMVVEAVLVLFYSLTQQPDKYLKT
tara:strand:+ start:1350 stop:1538 length:189 start_codon:yes stop_codon:yes gene_type:complete